MTDQPIDRDLVTRWIEALESGRYEQAKGGLHFKGDGFCCLGVLCDLVDPRGWSGTVAGGAMAWHGEQHAGLPVSVADRVGLSGLAEKPGEGGWNLPEDVDRSSLAYANDGGASFPEIAAALREFYAVPTDGAS